MPSEGLRRLITGFLFGTTGALIALSPVGKESGAHINPVVTLGFWMMDKLNTRIAIGYIFAQLVGASKEKIQDSSQENAQQPANEK